MSCAYVDINKEENVDRKLSPWYITDIVYTRSLLDPLYMLEFPFLSVSTWSVVPEITELKEDMLVKVTN